MLVSFDCYGTLIDWESGIFKSISGVLQKHDRFLGRSEILKLYSKFEPELEKVYRPYKEVLRLVMDRFGKYLGVELSEEERDALVKSIKDWPVFSDTPGALRKIKERHEIAVISNVDDDIFEITRRKIGVKFDYIITAQKARAYKPSLKVFELAHREFGVSKRNWIHVGQSVYHDIIPAKNFGLKTILVRRRGFGATPEIHGNADYEVEDLEGVLEILEEISQEVE